MSLILLHNTVMKNSIISNDYLKLHISVLLAGFTGVFGKLITLNEGLLVWYRLFFSFLMFYVILFFARKLPKENISDILKMVAIGMLLGLHFLLFYASIKYANVSVGVVCYSLEGFFTAVFNPLFNRKIFSLKEISYSLIAVLGISLIFHVDTHYRVGIIFGILSAALFSIFTICNKKLENGEFSKNLTSAKSMLFYELFGGTIFMSLVLPFYLKFNSLKFMWPVYSDLAYLLVLAFFCTIGLYILHIQALRSLSAFTVSLTGNLEPVYGILLAILFLGESKELSAVFYIGMFLILLSVFLQSISSIRERKKVTVDI